MAIRDRNPALCERMGLLVYDNSPAEQPLTFDGNGFGRFTYLHDPRNSGLAVAYNSGLEQAAQAGTEWLLLLDQDTELNDRYLQSLFATIESSPAPSVCALIPILMRGEMVLSPQKVGRFHNRSVTPDYTGISPDQLTALNSAACLRVRAVQAIGGFPREYWLDLLDHVVFHRLQAAGGRVQVLDTTIQHQLSFLNMEQEMSLPRYVGVLEAEWRYVRETMAGGGILFHRIRLLKRALTYAVRWKNKAYAKETLRAAVAQA